MCLIFGCRANNEKGLLSNDNDTTELCIILCLLVMYTSDAVWRIPLVWLKRLCQSTDQVRNLGTIHQRRPVKLGGGGGSTINRTSMDRGSSKQTMLDKGGFPKIHFLVGRLWWMAPYILLLIGCTLSLWKGCSVCIYVSLLRITIFICILWMH